MVGLRRDLQSDRQRARLRTRHRSDAEGNVAERRGKGGNGTTRDEAERCEDGRRRASVRFSDEAEAKNDEARRAPHRSEAEGNIGKRHGRDTETRQRETWRSVARATRSDARRNAPKRHRKGPEAIRRRTYQSGAERLQRRAPQSRVAVSEEAEAEKVTGWAGCGIEAGRMELCRSGTEEIRKRCEEKRCEPLRGRRDDGFLRGGETCPKRGLEATRVGVADPMQK